MNFTEHHDTRFNQAGEFPITKGDGEALLADDYGDDEENKYEEEDTYQPRPQLPKPFVAMRNLASLIKDLDAGLIDVDPEYQREVVWTADRMTGLVDSLMENFYIPPIILNKKRRSTVSGHAAPIHVFVCVDGKQRLSSVRAFIKGMIPCHDHNGDKWWFCEAARRRHVLPDDTKRMFLAKEFVSFEFVDISPEQEEDLFARVQMGVQLSPAEKMRASTGPWQELARLYVDDFPAVYSLMKDRARAKDFQLTLSCFSQVLEVMHPTAADGIPLNKMTHNALPKLLSNKAAVDDSIKSHLANVWTTFAELIETDEDTFTNANKYLVGVQTFAPIEMVAVVVIISMYADSRNNRLLLGDIKALRTALRENFVDLRMNAKVWRYTWGWLDEMEAIRGAVDGSTRTKELSSIPATSAISTPLLPTGTPTQLAGTKRARLASNSPLPTVLPPQNSVVVKQKQVAPNLADIRAAKRKRTDQGPMSSPGLSSMAANSNGLAVSANSSGSPSISQFPDWGLRSGAERSRPRQESVSSTGTDFAPRSRHISPPRPAQTPAQYHGAIDLTDDVEERDRLDLLSTFGAKPLPGKKVPNTPVALPQSDSRRHNFGASSGEKSKEMPLRKAFSLSSNVKK